MNHRRLFALLLGSVVFVSGCVTGETIKTVETGEEQQTTSTEPTQTSPATTGATETKSEPTNIEPQSTITPTEIQQTATQPPKTETTIQPKECKGTFQGTVKRIIDGDTLSIEGCDKNIRLSLVNTPESYQSGYTEANSFVASLCQVGSTVTIDQDDLQTYDKYGRILAVIYCQGKNLNAELLYNSLGAILVEYCSASEFSDDNWAQDYGCKQQPVNQSENCHASYPDVCIPSPPPDLDCPDISHRNFRVLPPDPHRFDGDKDGVGCET